MTKAIENHNKVFFLPVDLILSCDKLCARGVAGVATDTIRNDCELTCSVMSPRGHWWCVAVLGQIISLGLGGAQLLLLLWLIATHNKSALWSLVARAAASLPQWHTPLSQELHQRHNSCWQ